MFKFRFHRGGFAESMATVKEFNELYELVSYIEKHYDFGGLYPSDLSYKHMGYDNRNGWETYMVLIDNYGTIGYATSDINLAIR